MAEQSESTGGGQVLRLVDLHRSAEHAIGRFGNLLLSVSAAPPSRGLLQQTVEFVSVIAREYPAGVGMLVIIDVSSAPPDEEARSIVQQVYKQLLPMVGAFVYVVEGEGFAAAAKRGALTFVNMTMRAGFPLRVAGTLDEGIPWLRRTLGTAWLHGMPASRLVEVIGELRGRLAAEIRASGPQRR